MSSEREYLGSGAWGERLGGDRPEGHLATLDAQHAATPQRVATASQLFTQGQLGDFEAFGTTGRKFRHKATGREFVLAEEQVLEARDPRKSGVELFLIAGGQLLFLRPRYFDAAEVGIPGELVAGKLKRSPGGGIQVRDVASGAIVREQVRL